VERDLFNSFAREDFLKLRVRIGECGMRRREFHLLHSAFGAGREGFDG
jgi:hypothetical protein